MKKKPGMIIILIVVIVLVAAGAVWGKQYYEDRYVGTDYYSIVPMSYDMTPEKMYSMSGEEAGPGKKYSLTAYNEKGEARTIEFNVYGEKSSDFPQPGTYLFIKASKQIVVGWNTIEESNVPEGILSKLKHSQ